MKYIRSIFPNAIGGRPKAPCGYSRLIGFNNTSKVLLHSSFVKINPYALSSSYCRNLIGKGWLFLAIEDSLGCEFALSLILSLYSTLNQTFPNIKHALQICASSRQYGGFNNQHTIGRGDGGNISDNRLQSFQPVILVTHRH